jgi:TonB-linked SusC/RagA family outer membrane protein
MSKKYCFIVVAALLMCINSFAQTRTVSGKVVSESGEPLIGASITIKGTTSSTLTGKNGEFSIKPSAKATSISISFTGMETEEISIVKKDNITVVMKTQVTNLNDVIVVGYGSIRKADATGAVQRISREDLIRESPTNILQAIQGKLAGVNVTQNDGAPGAGLSIRVRGSNSFLGGTEPLYVIDGVPFNNTSSGTTPSSIGGDEKQTLNVMAFINPNDIESIDVLKDASATAIYGSRGANGVVLITTRKGRVGKDKVELIANLGMSEITRKIDVLTPYEYAAYQNLSFLNANRYDGTSYTMPYANLDPLKDLNTNWQDAIFRNGFQQQYTLNVSGGSENGSHSLTMNHISQSGIVQNSNFKKIGLSYNLYRNIGKNIKIGSSNTVSTSTTNGVKTGTDKSDAASAGVIRSAITFPATIDSVEEYDGSGDGFFITNPVIYTNNVLNKVTALNIFSSNYIEASLGKYLKIRGNLGFNHGSNTRDQYYPRTVYEGFSIRGWGLKSDNLWSSMVSEGLLTYNRKFNKHSIVVTGASTFERSNGQNKRVEAKTFPNDILQNENMEAAEQIMPVSTNRFQSTLISFLGRMNYSYNDKYVFSLSYREDGSSKFGKDNKWAGFASSGLSWKAHKEAFMKDLDKISNLTFRLSFGQTGNQGIGSYASLSKLNVYNYPFNGALQTGLADDVFSGPANASLKWETTSAYNGGFDLGILKDRLNIHVDVYLKKTNDLLQYVTTPSSTGFQRQLKNSGSVQNKGLEVSMDFNVINKKNFTWKTGGNIAFNRNKILSLGDGIKEQYASRISTRDAPFVQLAGYPIGALIGHVEDGYYDNEAEVRSSPAFANQPAAIIRRMIGEIKYLNLDKDASSISITDRMIIGDVNPDYFFGLTNSFQYKKFELNVFINGVQGNDIVNMNTAFNGNIGTSKNISQEVLDGAWQEGKNNAAATGPKAIRQFWRTLLLTRRFIEDGSFVRIKNVTLGYTLPANTIRGVSAVRLALGVNNLYTFTKYSGFDPEINSYGDNPALFGVDLGGYPNSRTFQFTVRCNF